MFKEEITCQTDNDGTKDVEIVVEIIEIMEFLANP